MLRMGKDPFEKAMLIMNGKRLLEENEFFKILLRAINEHDISIWNTFYRENKDKSEINFHRAFLEGNDLNGVDLHGIKLRGAFLNRVNMAHSNLANTDFMDAEMCMAILIGANLSKAYIANVDLQNADLSDTQLQDANLFNSNLMGTKLCRSQMLATSLNGAYLGGANLTGACLRGVYLQEAVLESTDLTDVNLEDGDLCGANWDGAILARTVLTGAKICGITGTPRIIEDITCSYLYLDRNGSERVPAHGNFHKGEFQEYLLCCSPTTDVLANAIKKGRKMNHVFISHIKEDIDIVKALADELEKNGITVWLDKERLQPGEEWHFAIETAIKKGMYFIACFSHSYLARETTFMNEELNIAIEQLRLRLDDEIWFIPVKLSDCEIPHFNIRSGKSLESKQYVELYKDWNEGMSRIINLIKQSGAGVQ